MGWKEIADDLARRIGEGELAPGSRLDSGESIAQAWGVSRHTAHRAIEELQRQGLVIRQRRWGTVVAATPVRTAHQVALVVDRYAPAVNFPSSEMVQGLQDGLGESSRLIVVDARSDAELELRRLKALSKEVDGLVVVPTTSPKTAQFLQRLAEENYPVVVLDRIPTGYTGDSVTTDNEAATLAVIRSLEAQGHRRIGFFSFRKLDFSSVVERHDAYVQALAEVGFTRHEPLERWFPRELERDWDQLIVWVRDALFAMTQTKDPITALYCVQDGLAAAALEAAVQLGLRTPEDFILATFNDWPAVMLRTPPGTLRIVQNTSEIGVAAAQLLTRRMERSGLPAQSVRIPAELVLPLPQRMPSADGLPHLDQRRS